MESIINIFWSLILVAMLLGGIAIIAIGFEEKNSGGPIGGAALIIGSVYFMSKEK